MAPYARPGRRARLFEDISQDLVTQIQRGDLKAGDRLPPERTLVEMYGVSRTAVREALRALTARGLVESHVGRGTFVRRPTTEHLTQKLRLVFADSATPVQVRAARMLVETEVVACAAEHRTPETLAALSEAVVEGRRNDTYYRALADAARVPLLGPILAALRGIEGDLRAEPVALRRVVAGIAAGDADAACEALTVRRGEGKPAPQGVA